VPVYVSNIFVIPDARRQGVATRLMDTVEEWARSWGAETVRLQSNHALREAHALYLKRGYVLVGTTELELRPEMTMLQFRKDL